MTTAEPQPAGQHGVKWLGERHPAVVCFSHLRWDFVYQRPQHLMTRWARDHDVYYVEEPVWIQGVAAWMQVRRSREGVHILTPHIAGAGADDSQRRLLDEFLNRQRIDMPVLWYYTPMSLAYSRHLRSALVVYDCMDELSAFRNAPPELLERERELLGRADIVFTGGYSLYEAKSALHPNVHAAPSSVDVAHFMAARNMRHTAPDQQRIPEPRLGFFGVLDERFDTELIRQVARLRPQWQFVFIGPVVKIDPGSLPQAANIHYLGGRPYDQLAAYLAGWQVALMPFALNDSTRYISPTKTPEYLAGGRPVVSTPIVDVQRMYGGTEVVRIAGDPASFVAAAEQALLDMADPGTVQRQADLALQGMSWDDTWRAMCGIMERAHARRHRVQRASAGHSSVETMPGRTARDKEDAYDYLIVGAGFAGAVLAERLAAGSDKRVLVIDKRPHIAGNAYDYYDDHGLLVHRYGPHIFHTNSEKVVDYLSRFTQWRPYEHRVLAHVDGMLVPMPINLTTLARLYGRAFSPAEAQAFLQEQAEPVDTISTSEDIVVSKVGRELYRKFFQGYTRKQWGLDPSELDCSVAARVPARLSEDDRYFTDAFQQMPAEGYTRMFERMLAHPNISVRLSLTFEQARKELRYTHMIYTGPVDEYFNHCYGKLPYRSLEFRHENLDREWLQPVGVVNYPAQSVPYTRITEYKHLTGQKHRRTAVTYEYPSATGDPYYPIPRPANAALYRRYQQLADATGDVHFVGRLATYRYYNMDQVVAQALTTYSALVNRNDGARPRPGTTVAA